MAAARKVVVAPVPFGRYRRVPIEPLAGKTVPDTNYHHYWERDGRFAELEPGEATASGSATRTRRRRSRQGLQPHRRQ